MNPGQASPREYLFGLEQFGIKLGLEQIRALLAALDRPEQAFPSILVAGTNGKGSAAAMIERGLRAAGYRTGLYTSPHLVDLEERFALDGAPIAPTALDVSIERVVAAGQTLEQPPSFFEATTAAALDAFREAAVDIAVLEVGLGGRLDATNAVDPRAVAITLVDFDHEQYLGSSLEAIAFEKAGVIKKDGLVVLGQNRAEVRDVISRQCAAVGATLVQAEEQTSIAAEMIDGRVRVHELRTPHARYEALELGLRGRHQIQNAITAVRLMEEIGSRSIPISHASIGVGIQDVSWPGRLELRRWHAIDILLDGAHNPSGARALAAYLQETYARRLPLVLGLMRDKNAEAILGALLPAVSSVVFTAARTPRAANPPDLVALALSIAPGMSVTAEARPVDAIVRAAASGSPVVVAGSLYLVGEVRAALS